MSYSSPCSFKDPCPYHLRAGGVFFLEGPGGSLGCACELPRPHDDIDSDDDHDDVDDDDDDNVDVGVDDVDVVVDDDGQRCGSALRLRANDCVETVILVQKYRTSFKKMLLDVAGRESSGQLVTEEIISQALIDVFCFIIGCGLFVLEGALIDAFRSCAENCTN